MTAVAESHSAAPGWVSTDSARAAVEVKMESGDWKAIDEFEEYARNLPQAELPVKHIFTPGLYTRHIFMPAGAKLTTRIHLCEHPFVISAGSCSVWDIDTGWVRLSAPYIGVTKPATRRKIVIHEDTIWTTFHINPTNETDPDKIGLAITYSEGRHADLGAASAHPALT